GDWLLSDSKHDVPASPSGVYEGDTQMLTKTTLEGGKDADTQTDVTPPTTTNDEPPKESEDKVVETESGAKIKISAAKQKIEKTREDTSRAAADILRRMMRGRS